VWIGVLDATIDSWEQFTNPRLSSAGKGLPLYAAGREQKLGISISVIHVLLHVGWLKCPGHHRHCFGVLLDIIMEPVVDHTAS